MKTIAQILLGVLFATSMTAQMSVGFKAGATMNKYRYSQTINDAVDATTILGYAAGAAIEMAFGGRFGIGKRCLLDSKRFGL